MSPRNSMRQSLARRRDLGLCLLALLLAGCGGLVDDAAPQQPVTPTPGSRTSLAGLYQARAGVSAQEFISLVLPSSANPNNADWYGWYFRGPNPNTDPYLFSGTLSLGNNGAAASADLRADTSGTLGLGSASLSNASAAGFHASIAAMAQQLAFEFDASAAPLVDYKFDRTAELADLTTRWSGNWSSAGSSYNASLGFIAQGANAVLSANSSLWDCDVSALTLSPLTVGNAYSAKLVMPTRTGCSWTPSSAPQTLNGVAFVHRVGTQNQLELMLLDNAGRGVSFRGNPW